MVDTVAVTKLFEGAKHVYYQFTNISDGTGESAVTKIDISTLTSDGRTPTSLSLIEIVGNVSGFNYAELLWDHGTDVQIGVFSGDVSISYDIPGGNHDTGSGGTGDILLTTNGGAAGSTYDLVTKWRKKFD
jgi:hypothetical protein